MILDKLETSRQAAEFRHAEKERNKVLYSAEKEAALSREFLKNT